MEKTSRHNKLNTIVRFEDGTEIRSDTLNWVLYIPSPRSYWYYSTLDQVFTDLLNLKIKELASQDSRKNIQSLGEAIIKACEEVQRIMTTLMDIKISAQSRLEMQEGSKKRKDD